MHEAVAFDKYGNAYLTEDRSEGLIYKFVPRNKGSLIEGDLFALKVENIEDSRNWTQDLMKTYTKLVGSKLMMSTRKMIQ